LFFLSSFFLAYSQRSEIKCLPYFHAWCGLSANLGYRSETCCTRLAGNAGRKKSPKNRHLGTITQLRRAISSQPRHISTIGKTLSSSNMSSRCPPQYGELQQRLRSIRYFGVPQLISTASRLGSVTARQSSSASATLVGVEQRCHLCSAGRPSGWALAHILVSSFFFLA